MNYQPVFSPQQPAVRRHPAWLRWIFALFRMINSGLKILAIILFFYGIAQLVGAGWEYLIRFGQQPFGGSNWYQWLLTNAPGLIAWLDRWPIWLLDPVVVTLLSQPSWMMNMLTGLAIFIITPARTPWLYVAFLFCLRAVVGVKR